MNDWINVKTLTAFILGVMLAATVKNAVGGLRAKSGV